MGWCAPRSVRGGGRGRNWDRSQFVGVAVDVENLPTPFRDGFLFIRGPFAGVHQPSRFPELLVDVQDAQPAIPERVMDDVFERAVCRCQSQQGVAEGVDPVL